MNIFLEQIIQPFVYTYIFGFTRESFTSDGDGNCVKQNKHPVNMTIFFRASFVICLPWVPEATRLLNPAETSVRSEVSEASEGPNASSLWWRTPMVLLCLIQILYLITDWLFKNVFLPATAVGQKRSREMNRFFQ